MIYEAAVTGTNCASSLPTCGTMVAMRRGFSILLLALYVLGPLGAVLPGAEDSKLPACCRRHGAHHCAMADAAAARMAAEDSSETAFSAPSHCPLFPKNGEGMAAPIAADLPQNHAAITPVEERFINTAQRLQPLNGLLQSAANRGPPTSLPA